MVAISGTRTLEQHQKETVGFLLSSVETGITAQADGTKANATQLAARINRIDTSAGAADSVLLPQGEVGLEVVIINDGSNTVQVFGKGTDTIDGVATDTGVVITNAKRAVFYCTEIASGAGKWQSMLGAVST